ncbi:MAG: type 4a pilus biogenesis protein PilO [Phycisphaerales bacterium]|nr:type 4a pilus biogenesis protein PilO [Phycisphaerales bacterium]
MNGFSASIREWAGCAIAIALVIGAAVYALARGTRVGADIRTLRLAADSLNVSAQEAPTAVIDAGELERVSRMRVDFQSRLRDSMKLGLVVTQLSEEARRAGLQIVEIQPQRPRDMNSARFPLFKVTVVGDYQRIATYMGGCRQQRIPARVVDFNIVPATEGGEHVTGQLRADITVEAYASEAVAAIGGL